MAVLNAVVDYFKKKPDAGPDLSDYQSPEFPDFGSFGAFTRPDADLWGGVAESESQDDLGPGMSDGLEDVVYDAFVPAVASRTPLAQFLAKVTGRGSKPVASLPSVNMLTHLRRVVDDCVEDLSGHRFVVWEVEGQDSSSDHAISGWMSMLNNMEFPFQVLIRQHAPDFADVRRQWRESRPECMRSGRMNVVGNSLLDFTEELETCGSVVARRWYICCSSDRVMELTSSLSQAGLKSTRLMSGDLELLVEACVSGMGFGHRQDFYQVRAENNLLELNQRYVALMEVHKWPRQITLAFIEDLLRTGEELDLSFWIYPVSQRESHSRLQMQRSRFEGARMAAHQNGKLVSPDVETAIEDATRIAEQVSRGVSRLYRRTMMVAVYSRDRQSLKASVERVHGHSVP